MLIRRTRKGHRGVSWEEALSAVSPSVRRAAEKAVEVLRAAGVDFAGIGGLAGGAADDAVLRSQLRTAVGTVPVIPIEGLVRMKLGANRPQDRTDIYRLVHEAGVDPRVLARWRKKHDSDLLPRLERALEP